VIVHTQVAFGVCFHLVWPSLEAAGSCSCVNEFSFFNLLIILFW
jgi:hypothetical protein